MSGFDNEHASEALPGALPVGQNSPQKVRPRMTLLLTKPLSSHHQCAMAPTSGDCGVYPALKLTPDPIRALLRAVPVWSLCGATIWYGIHRSTSQES